jgi:hypothetical protein
VSGQLEAALRQLESGHGGRGGRGSRPHGDEEKDGREGDASQGSWPARAGHSSHLTRRRTIADRSQLLDAARISYA